MLKLHHMNLLNEIQETTLMMNLYQQQQLQQQQQQLQQQASAEQLGTNNNNSDSHLSMLMQQQNGVGSQSIDGMFGNGQIGQHRASLGLGGSSQINGFTGSNGLSNNVRGSNIAGSVQGHLQQNIQSSIVQKGNNGARSAITENRAGDEPTSQPVPAVGSDSGAGTRSANNGSNTENVDNKRAINGGEESVDHQSPKRVKTEDPSVTAADNATSQES